MFEIFSNNVFRFCCYDFLDTPVFSLLVKVLINYLLRLNRINFEPLNDEHHDCTSLISAVLEDNNLRSDLIRAPD